ncbi:hypothetical protein WICMUC_001399 [Wickerhamomyces mucosus]|uniref:Uncharacterized protein n=1 Tax=Wickerhamomyces mucosus TaxID=1378264 RepID=A0A9P8PUH1_9ASCO|nr:hypothetical protein WICMUC_001399 [Wickerhamomyces mucosus]
MEDSAEIMEVSSLSFDFNECWQIICLCSPVFLYNDIFKLGLEITDCRTIALNSSRTLFSDDFDRFSDRTGTFPNSPLTVMLVPDNVVTGPSSCESSSTILELDCFLPYKILV